MCGKGVGRQERIWEIEDGEGVQQEGQRGDLVLTGLSDYSDCPVGMGGDGWGADILS